MNLLADKELCLRLYMAFPLSFVTMKNEFIVYPPQNTYFSLDNVASELELNCKILEWCSREAHKAFNKRSMKYHFDGINKFFGTEFTPEDMEIIYTKLGNCVNRELTIKFIESCYDIELLDAYVRERRTS